MLVPIPASCNENQCGGEKYEKLIFMSI